MFPKRSLPTLFLTLLLLAPSCSPAGVGPVGSTGSIQLKLAIPQSQMMFGVRKIPSETVRFKIQISGTGLDKAKEDSISLQGGETRTYSAKDLPIGPKTIKVTAYDQAKGLAAASATAEVKPGETASVTLELQSILKSLTLSLQQAMPLDLQLQTDIAGSNIEPAPLAATQFLPQGQRSVTFTDIPGGEKQISVKILIPLSNQDAFASAPIQKSFNLLQAPDPLTSEPLTFAVAQTSDDLTITLKDIFQAFKAAMQSGEFFRKLPADKVKALVALIPPEMFPEIQTSLLALPEDQLKQLQDLLPPQLFSQFPQLAELLKRLLNTVPSPGPTALPTSIPIAKPTPEASPTPKATPDLSNFKIEISEAGVLANPPRVLTPPTISKFPAEGPLVLVQGTRLFGAGIRCTYNGDDAPILQVKVTNLDDRTDTLNTREYPPITSNKDESGHFQANVPFTEAGQVLPGIDLNRVNNYRIQFRFTAQNGKVVTEGSYYIRVSFPSEM